jgi:hypothetical protein
VVKWCKARAQAWPCLRRTGRSRWRFAVVCGEEMTSRTLQCELAALYADVSIAMAAHNGKVRTVGDRLAQAIGKWEAQPRHRRGRLLQPSASAAERMQGQGWQRVQGSWLGSLAPVASASFTRPHICLFAIPHCHPTSHLQQPDHARRVHTWSPPASPKPTSMSATLRPPPTAAAWQLRAPNMSSLPWLSKRPARIREMQRFAGLLLTFSHV